MAKAKKSEAVATCDALLAQLRAAGRERNRQGMARFGINAGNAVGVSVAFLRDLAKAHRRDHALAAKLWASGVHEARILAAFVEDPAAVTPAQMEAWAAELDSWDLTDQAATALFDRTPHGWSKARAWAARSEEYVRRAAFSLMAGLAVHDKRAPDADFLALLPLIERGARDPRNFVKKAVSWALRQIGKRNAALHAAAIACAERIQQAAGDERMPEARAARWVAADALRELGSDKVRERFTRPAGRKR